ncbi:NUP-1 protein [Trypanosoma conorhini]|uniref:NUP-1 protein n=1 Tax=Trypanosoma conorhini TaxID=83891 RepID=A0A3R7M5P3_9TRYP|nr:NUP-1 protein [Trypanosoma conorhini]RNF27061.1 NUP-1 protein [Trypanosoma conorhini]
MRELERGRAELLKVQRDYRALERLLRASGRLSMSRVEGEGGDEEELEASFTHASTRNTEGVELAQFLQISSLQTDLMLSRRTCHQLEARQEELRTALERSEWQLACLPPSAEESHAELRRVRGQLGNLQLEYSRLQERYESLKRQRVEDVEQLQQQNERLVLQLREKRDKLGGLTRQMRESELAAKQQAEELQQAFNVLEGQMRVLREEVGCGQPQDQQEGRSRRRQRAREVTEAESKMLQGRVTFLEHALQQKEAETQRLQEELQRNEAQLDQFEDQVTVATQRLETTARKSTQLEQTVGELQRANEELREELGVVKERVLVHAERRTSQRAASTGAPSHALHGAREPSLPPARGEDEERATPAARPPAAARRPAAKRGRSSRSRA